MMRLRFAIMIAAAVLAACATVPKPQELLSFEAMREGKPYQLAQEQQQALVLESDNAYKQAISAWEDEEIEMAKHWAMLGAITLRSALSRIAQETEQQKLAEYQAQLKQTQARQRDMQAKLQQAEEQIMLLEQLASARNAAKTRETQLQEKLSEAQKLAEAQRKLDEAKLALKLAETVEATKYAQGDYSSAQALLTKAESALQASNTLEATTTAELAKHKANAAYSAARPQFMNAKQTAERQALNQALQKDASAISGVTMKMKTIGQTQQIILPILDLFQRDKVTPRAEKMVVLNQIAALLQRYPDYPVIVNGHTSYRVRQTQRYAVSQGRAQQVANHFASLGIPLKRLAVSGRGAEELVDRKLSTTNDRVEIIILFQ